MRGSASLGKRRGLNKKGLILDNGGEHWSIVTTKKQMQHSHLCHNTPMFFYYVQPLIPILTGVYKRTNFSAMPIWTLAADVWMPMFKYWNSNVSYGHLLYTLTVSAKFIFGASDALFLNPHIPNLHKWTYCLYNGIRWHLLSYLAGKKFKHPMKL